MTNNAQIRDFFDEICILENVKRHVDIYFTNYGHEDEITEAFVMLVSNFFNIEPYIEVYKVLSLDATISRYFPQCLF